ncbi:pali-domain-containing protein [Peniophora sp. CONT]|nr:pali-domain-containing protein [Peniophora sp. CONT]
MGFIRPATPGLLVTLTATVLLAVVTFCVPWIKSVYFLKAGLSVEGISGNITFGTLGYCTELANGTTCTSPHVGYQLDINKLVGDNTKIQIPQVVVKWITYALVLHIVALVLAAGSTIFGILAHIREFSGSCLSTCISGLGAAVTLAAFIFDLAFFFIAKSRINAVDGGFAEIGNAVWLTLAAWLLLLFSGCFYCIGRCCISRRPRDTLPKHRDGSQSGGFPGFNNNVNTYEDAMRLDAVKAEADRKARAKRGEVGLPAFQEYDPTQPLTSHNDEDESNYHPVTGYAQAAPGTRAVDEYYNPNVAGANAYPPGPRREGSNHSTTYVDSSAVVPLGGAAAAAGTNAYLAAGQAHARGTPSQYSGHEQYPSNASGYAHSQAPSNVAYGQAVTHDYPSRSNSSPYHDPYAQQAPANPPGFGNAAQYSPAADPYYAAPQRQASHDAYYQSPQMQPQDAGQSYYASPPVQSPPIPVHSPPQRHYTLGGGGYGDNVVPDFHDETPPHAFAGASSGSQQYEDSPPVYDDGMSQPPGVYGAKGGHH